MFGRRRRRDEVEARSALRDALARLEQGFEAQAQAQSGTDATVQDLYSTVVETRSDLIKTVEYLYSVCSRLIERIESEQVERQALVDTLAELSGPSTIELEPSGERVLGGSFPASPAESVDLDLGVVADHRDREPRWA